MRRVGQRAIQPVGPGMILALNSPGELPFLILAQQRAAMAADIVKSANISPLVPRDDDAGVGDAAHEVVAGIGNLGGAPGAKPHIKVNSLHLALEPLRIGVIALW